MKKKEQIEVLVVALKKIRAIGHHEDGGMGKCRACIAMLALTQVDRR